MIKFPSSPILICHTIHLRSRYAEVDSMGYVYYSRYLEYFEYARTETIRSLGLSYSEIEKKGILLPVVFSQIQYLHPVHYDEEISISTLIFSVPKARLQTYYKVCYKNDIRVYGYVELCFMNKKKRCVGRCPLFIRERFLHKNDSVEE